MSETPFMIDMTFHGGFGVVTPLLEYFGVGTRFTLSIVFVVEDGCNPSMLRGVSQSVPAASCDRLSTGLWSRSACVEDVAS